MNQQHTMSRMRFLLLPFGLCVLCLSLQARGDSGWLLTTEDFKQQPISVAKIDSAGIHPAASGANSPAVIPFGSFLQLDRAAVQGGSSQEKYLLLTASGDRIPGEPVGYKDEQILWKGATVGQMSVPLKNARALLRMGKTAEGGEQSGTEDRILMANGDSLKGLVTDIADGKVKINSNNSDVEVPLENIAAIYFAPAGKPKTAAARAFRIRLSDGTALSAESIESDGTNLGFALVGGARRQIPLGSVVGIEQLNGPVSWLSSRLPEATVQTPYFGGLAWPTRMDRTVTGKPIEFAGRVYARGIGVHSYSRIDYALDGSYKAFRTQYAIANEGKTQYADVTVRIKLDGRTVHEQQHVRAGTLSPIVLIDVPGDAKLLMLEVDYGDANDVQDHFNWIEPALLRQKPAAPPAPATQPSTRPAGEA